MARSISLSVLNRLKEKRRLRRAPSPFGFIARNTGDASCRTGSQEASHVLRAMNPNGDGARRSLRFSFSRFNTEREIARAIEIVPKAIEKLRQIAAPQTVAAAT